MCVYSAQCEGWADPVSRWSLAGLPLVSLTLDRRNHTAERGETQDALMFVSHRKKESTETTRLYVSLKDQSGRWLVLTVNRLVKGVRWLSG